MEISIFLAKVIGFYLIIVSLLTFFRFKELKQLIGDVVNQRGIIFVFGFFTLIFGLLLVVSHNIWVMDWRAIITILAWLILIGGIVRLFFPESTKHMGKWWLDNPNYLIGITVIYFIVGLYLIYKAFTV